MVYLQDKKTVVENPDLSKGRIELQTEEIQLEEVPFIEEKGHYETEREYPNGGKDLKWVVDVPGQNYQPAKTEVKTYQVYIPYTYQEMKEIALKQELSQITDWFDSTDYMALKVMRGNWEKEDPRYIQYLADYAEKHARKEAIESQLALFKGGTEK